VSEGTLQQDWVEDIDDLEVFRRRAQLHKFTKAATEHGETWKKGSGTLS
jgi:hypothetical protein